MSTILRVVILTIGAFLALFIVWRKLHEDYYDSDIFSLFLMTAFGTTIGYSAALLANLTDLSFWAAVGGGALFSILRSRRVSIRVFEMFEAMTPAFFVFLLAVIVSMALPVNWGLLGESSLVLDSLGFFTYSTRSFRKFLWYPSGKVGFAALATLALYALVRALLTLVVPNLLLFSRPLFDIVGGIIGGSICLVVLYSRSGRTLTRDLVFWKLL